MTDLIRQIEAAQVRAGEDAVIAHLNASGFGSQPSPAAGTFRLSFDDMGFGFMDEARRCIKKRVGPARPIEWSNQRWHEFAGGILQLVEAQRGPDLGEDYRLMLVEHRRFVRELDVALNGEAGAATQASLCDLVAQVRAQQPVQILNLADGMRINFRAPDGRRATLHMGRFLYGYTHEVAGTMRDAIAAYPVAGEPLPVEEPGEHQCQFCGVPSAVDPADQTAPADYYQPNDHEAPK